MTALVVITAEAVTDAPALPLPALPRPAPCGCSEEEIAQCCQVIGEVAKEVLK